MRIFAVLLALFVLLPSAPHAQDGRLRVTLVTDEPEAVLAILARRKEGSAPSDADWRRLFASEGYVRLGEREAGMRRPFTDSAFRAFVLSPELAARDSALRAALDAWRAADLTAAARRAFAYLPAGATIRAKVYPSIKPRTNSFVWEARTDPAIFLYLDPELPAAKFENTVAHELHHVGVGTVCPADPDTTLPRGLRDALAWMGGFAEGRAVLAAAGGPDVHPHAASSAAERAVWERDMANAERDVRRMEGFFLELLDGELPEEEQSRRGMAFVVSDSVPQGSFYTVGWLMASTVERRLGRERLVASLCDPRAFLADYQQAAREESRSAPKPLPLWSDELLRRIGAGG
ncbi:MAG TPA: DUF5700 domain-containing putative Zn-dependent protease [Longimicrobiaceae bacterium]|nr:DUF5700 domain-containing putative Zn-dependent protease [Longimicrobiaceae bacterium]